MDIRRVFSCWLVAGIGVVLYGADQPASIPFAQVPPPVQKGIQAQLGNGQLGQITRDAEGDAASYSVEITKGGKARDYTFDETGALTSVEVLLQETPPAVQKAIQAQAGQGTVESIEKSMDGATVSYDVDWQSKDGAEHSFSVLESGALECISVTLEETPTPVQATIKQQLADGQLKEISKTMEADGVYYDVTVNQIGVDRDFTVTASGKLDSRQVLLGELPPSVQTTIQRTVGSGTVVRIDQVFERIKKVFPFEVESVVNGKSFYFNVGPNGGFLGVEP